MSSKYLTYEGLQFYHGLLTNYIDSADLKAIKHAALDDGYLLLYRVENPGPDAEPAFRIPLGSSGYDIISDDEIEEIFGVRP